MKFTKQNIEKLNKQAIEANDSLVESVTNYILDKFDEYDDPKQIVVDVVEHGCVSGIVGETYLLFRYNCLLREEQRRNQPSAL